MYVKQTLFVLLSAWLVSGQRPSFAGTKPIGYPILTDKPASDGLGNRFGEDLVLPLEANGDRDLVERISKMPIDQQPFWYINWKALEEQRKNPQSYPQKPNSFLNNMSSGNPNPGNDINTRSGNDMNTKSNSASSLTSKFGETSEINNSNIQYSQNQNYGNYRNSRRHNSNYWK